MAQNYRIRQFGALFSEGIEADPPTNAAQRRRKRESTLRGDPSLDWGRLVADLEHVLKPAQWARLARAADFVWRERSIGVAGLPDVRSGALSPDGLAALAQDLSPDVMIDAYSRGLFLRETLGQAGWWAPAERLTLNPAQGDGVAARTALANAYVQGWRVTLDRDFEAVVAGCARDTVNRRLPHAPGMRTKMAFAALHDAGFAHSVEVCDRGGRLIAGLYGVATGRVFITQARFEAQESACDLAIATLNRHLADWGFVMHDGCVDQSLVRLGFAPMPRDVHAGILTGHLSGGRLGRWLVTPGLAP